MTAKQYLSQLKKLDIQISQLMSEKEYLEGALVNKSITIKDIRVKSSLPADPMADAITRIVDLEKELDKKIDRLIDLRTIIVEQIQSLQNSLYMQILYKRFVEYKRCTDVFDEIRKETPTYTYSDRQLYRAYDSALMEFSKIMKRHSWKY